MTSTQIDNFSGEELLDKIRECVREELQAHNPVKEHDPDELLTFEQTREMLHVSKPTLHRWKKEGVIGFERIQGRILFKRGAIMAALKSVNLKKHQQ